MFLSGSLGFWMFFDVFGSFRSFGGFAVYDSGCFWMFLNVFGCFGCLVFS